MKNSFRTEFHYNIKLMILIHNNNKFIINSYKSRSILDFLQILNFYRYKNFEKRLTK